MIFRIIHDNHDLNYVKEWLLSFKEYTFIHFNFKVIEFSSFVVDTEKKTIFHSYKHPTLREKEIKQFDFNDNFFKIKKLLNESIKMDELKITKEKVLEAASKCSQAKETLKTLFPEAFEDDKKFINNILKNIEIRKTGNFREKSIYLPFSDKIDYTIIKDDHNILCLIPTKKR